MKILANMINGERKPPNIEVLEVEERDKWWGWFNSCKTVDHHQQSTTNSMSCIYVPTDNPRMTFKFLHPKLHVGKTATGTGLSCWCWAGWMAWGTIQ